MQTKKLVDQSNSEWFYRRRSLHKMRERELILKGGFSKGGTTIPEEERWTNFTQQLVLESPRRSTVWTNLPYMDRRKSYTRAQWRHRKEEMYAKQSSQEIFWGPASSPKFRPSQETCVPLWQFEKCWTVKINHRSYFRNNCDECSEHKILIFLFLFLICPHHFPLLCQQL